MNDVSLLVRQRQKRKMYKLNWDLTTANVSSKIKIKNSCPADVMANVLRIFVSIIDKFLKHLNVQTFPMESQISAAKIGE